MAVLGDPYADVEPTKGYARSKWTDFNGVADASGRFKAGGFWHLRPRDVRINHASRRWNVEGVPLSDAKRK